MAQTILDHLFRGRRDRGGKRFDERHGIETSETIPRAQLTGMPTELRQHSGEYVPTNLALFNRIVRKSRLDPAEFTFVDLGSGKGRVVIRAASYPFKAILGVEADADLYRISRANLERAHLGENPRVSVVHADARVVDLPQGNLFIFMYSPFRGVIFREVAERLAAIAREPGRALAIAYSSDWEADALEQTGCFVRFPMRRRQFWAPPTVSFFFNEAANHMRRRGR
jgi:16S rRNA G966 N2-methylase RsmD